MARKAKTGKKAPAAKKTPTKLVAGSTASGSARGAGAKARAKSGKGASARKVAVKAAGAARASMGSASGVAYVALMRGINVGGKNRLAMADLVRIFTAAGCGDVRTYIQSGNVAFTAEEGSASAVMAEVMRLIEKRHGLRVPVVVRRLEEVRAVIAANPFLKAGADPETLHVMFLADHPAEEHVKGLDAARSAGDSFEVVGREIYLCMRKGVADSKLTNAYFDSKLKTVSTGRNWRTVVKLLEM